MFLHDRCNLLIFSFLIGHFRMMEDKFFHILRYQVDQDMNAYICPKCQLQGT